MDIIKYLNIGNHIWNLWLRIDRWWGKKKDLEKSNLRKNFFIAVLISIIIYIIVRNNIKIENLEYRRIVRENNLIRQIDFLKERDTEELRKENKEVKEKNKIMDSLKIELEIIKRSSK